MKKVMFVLVVLIIVLLPGLGHSQEPSDNGTVPPYALWLPVVVGPKVCEDPGITDWGYVNYRMCSSVVCWTVRGFYIEYENADLGNLYSDSVISGYARVKGDEWPYDRDMRGSIYYGGEIVAYYPIEPGTTYEVSFKLQCKDKTWTDWSDWKEIIVPAE